MATATAIAGNLRVPDGWQLVRLGDVAEVVMGQSPPGESVVDWDDAVGSDDGLPFIQGNAEFGNKFPSPLKWCVQPFKVSVPGDILMSVRAPVGETNRVDRQLGIGRGLSAVRFHTAGQGFGWHILNHAKEALARVTQGSTFSAIAGGELRNLSILLPPLPEQRAIAAVLDSIDDAIEGAEAVIAGTEQLRDSLLHDLLTRGLPGHHTEWHDVPGLGTIPADWEVVRLGDVIGEGPTNGIYKPDSEYGSGVCLIRIDDFAFGEFENFGDFQRIRATEEEIGRYEVRKDDIVINRVNSLSHIGKSVLIPQVNEPTLFESNMMRIRFDRCTDPRFGALVLFSNNTRRYYRSRAKKAVQQASINQQDVSELPFPLPPFTEQQAIAALLDRVDVTLEQVREERSGLQLLKMSTAGALLTGLARVGGKNE